MTFSSATHDIAADGFYMLGLTQHEQSLFVGIRSTFYRFATIGAQGGLLALADSMQNVGGYSIQSAWQWTFLVTAVVFFALFAWHSIALPKVEGETDPEAKVLAEKGGLELIVGMGTSIVTFFTKPQALVAIAFMLLYRFPEALLEAFLVLQLVVISERYKVVPWVQEGFSSEALLPGAKVLCDS